MTVPQTEGLLSVQIGEGQCWPSISAAQGSPGPASSSVKNCEYSALLLDLCVCVGIKSDTHWKTLAQCVDKACARNASAVAGWRGVQCGRPVICTRGSPRMPLECSSHFVCDLGDVKCVNKKYIYIIMAMTIKWHFSVLTVSIVLETLQNYLI